MAKKHTPSFEEYLDEKRANSYHQIGYSAVIDKAVAKEEYDALYPKEKEEEKEVVEEAKAKKK